MSSAQSVQESVSMHKSPTPFWHPRMNEARLKEEGESDEERKKDRRQEADGKKGSPTKQKKKNYLGNPIEAIPIIGTAQVNKACDALLPHLYW